MRAIPVPVFQCAGMVDERAPGAGRGREEDAGQVLRRLRRCFLAQIGIRHARQIQQHLRQGHGFALH